MYMLFEINVLNDTYLLCFITCLLLFILVIHLYNLWLFVCFFSFLFFWGGLGVGAVGCGGGRVGKLTYSKTELQERA